MHLVRDMVMNQQMEVPHVLNYDQVANALTKGGLSIQRFHKLKDKLKVKA